MTLPSQLQRSGSFAAESTHSARLASIFDPCPMCDKTPREPARVEGQFACRGCTGSCSICGSSCVPGDDTCLKCLRTLRAAVAA